MQGYCLYWGPDAVWGRGGGVRGGGDVFKLLGSPSALKQLFAGCLFAARSVHNFTHQVA